MAKPDEKPDPTLAPQEMLDATLAFAKAHNAKLAKITQAERLRGAEADVLRGGTPTPDEE